MNTDHTLEEVGQQFSVTRERIRQIAERMFLAEKTVKNYVSNMLAKMGMSRRTEAAVYSSKLADRDKRS